MRLQRKILASKGFTLIELLAVISIIALLMAILTPVLQRVRKQAYYTVCMSNQRQMITGFIAHAQSNDDKLPDRVGICKNTPEISGFYGSPWTWPDEVMQPLRSYFGDNLKLVSCPANKSRILKKATQVYKEIYGSTTPVISDLWFTAISYLPGMASREHFGDALDALWKDTSKRPYSAADICLWKNRSDKLITVDLNCHHSIEGWVIINHSKFGRSEGGTVFPDWGPYQGMPGLKRSVKLIEGGNRGYVDGSVESVKRDVMSTNDMSVDESPLGHWGTGVMTYFW